MDDSLTSMIDDRGSENVGHGVGSFEIGPPDKVGSYGSHVDPGQDAKLVPRIRSEDEGVDPQRGTELTPQAQAERDLVKSGTFGVLSVFTITFFNVSGGPWGSEDMFGTVGPLWGVVGILVFAITFSIPQCLITTELTCAFPKTNAGYAVWVREAFGDFWAVQECYWNWVSGVVDTAVYPVLICDSVVKLLGITAPNPYFLWLWKVLLTVILSIPTVISASSFPIVLGGCGAATLGPVVIFIFWAAMTGLDTTTWLETNDSLDMPTITKFANSVFWNLEGWDCICTCATMLKAPKEKTLLRGLFLGLGLVVATYTFTLLAAAGARPLTQPWREWSDGSLAGVAESMSPWLGAIMMFAAAAGNAGLYLTEFFEDAYQLQGSADVGIAPRIFSWRPQGSDAPWPVAGLQAIMICLLVSFDFTDILAFDNFFTGLAVLFQFLAFVKLRIRRPDLVRPFRVPLPCLVTLAPALMILSFVLYGCFSSTYLIALNGIACGIGLPYGLWVVQKTRRERENGRMSAFDAFLED